MRNEQRKQEIWRNPDLYKVSGYQPTHSKHGINISLLRECKHEWVDISVNGQFEFHCVYYETHSFVHDEKTYELRLSNTFQEHWGNFFYCYVLALRIVNADYAMEKKL